MAQGQDTGVTQDFERITIDDDRDQAAPSDASPARPDGVDTLVAPDKSGPALQEPRGETSKGVQRAGPMMPSASSLADEGVLPSPVSTSVSTPFAMDAAYWIPGPDGMPMAFTAYGQPLFFPAPGSPFPLSPVSDDGSAAAASAAAAAVAAAGVGGFVGAYSPYGTIAALAPVGEGGGGPMLYGMAPQQGGGYDGYDPVAAMMAPYMGMVDPQAQAQAYFQAAAMGSFGVGSPTRSGRQQYSHSAPPSPGRGGRRGRSSGSPGARIGAHGGAPTGQQYTPPLSQPLPPSGAARQRAGTPAMPVPIPVPGQHSPAEAFPPRVGHSSAPSSPGKDSIDAPDRLRHRSASTTDVLSETHRGPRAGLGALVGSSSADEQQPGGEPGGVAYASARKAADVAVISVVRDVGNAEAWEEEALAREARGVREALKRGTSLAPLQSLPRQSTRFFVVKSYSEDDVHKALKYRCWSSTVGGNRKLDAAFRACCAQSPPGRLLIFFSVNSSGQFCGVAEMTSAVDFGVQAPYWQQLKWSGKFALRWHCVMDVPNAALRHIMLASAASPPGPDAQPQPPKPVTNSRDAQELPYDAGMDVLRVFMAREGGTTLLDDMLFYSQREAERDRQRRSGYISAVTGRRAHPGVHKAQQADASESGALAGEKEQ